MSFNIICSQWIYNEHKSIEKNILILTSKLLQFCGSIVILALAPDRDSSAWTPIIPLASTSIQIEIYNVCEVKLGVKPVKVSSPMNV